MKAHVRNFSLLTLVVCTSSLAYGDNEIQQLGIQYQQQQISQLRELLNEERNKGLSQNVILLENAIKELEQQVQQVESRQESISKSPKLDDFIRSEQSFLSNYQNFDVINISLGDDIKTLRQKLSERFSEKQGSIEIKREFSCGSISNDSVQQNGLGDDVDDAIQIMKGVANLGLGYGGSEKPEPEPCTGWSEEGQKREKIYIKLNSLGKSYEIHYNLSGLQLGKNQEECEQGIRSKKEEMVASFGNPFIQKNMQLGWGLVYDDGAGEVIAHNNLLNMKSDLRLAGSGYVAVFDCDYKGKLSANITLFHLALQAEGNEKPEPKTEKADF